MPNKTISCMPPTKDILIKLKLGPPDVFVVKPHLLSVILMLASRARYGGNQQVMHVCGRAARSAAYFSTGRPQQMGEGAGFRWAFWTFYGF